MNPGVFSEMASVGRADKRQCPPGISGDAGAAATVLGKLAADHLNHFQSYTVGFGAGAPKTLKSMAFANGQQDKNKYRAAAVGNLTEAFTAVAKSIAPGRVRN